MPQIGFGLTQGSNGPQFGPVLMLTPTETQPSAYESHYETPEGVHVKATFDTDNQALADRYEADVATKMNWKIVDATVDETSLIGEITIMWLVAILTAVVLPFVLMLGASILHSANYLDVQKVDWVWDHMARIGLWTLPIIGISLTIATIFTYSSEK